MKHNKSIMSRCLACFGAFFLSVYALADVASAAAQAAGTDRVPDETAAYETYVSEEATQEAPTEEATREYSEEVSGYLEEALTYEELSDEARQFLSEENIPLAGYEEYPAESLAQMQMAKPEGQTVLAGEGEDPGSDTDPIVWNEIVDLTYVPEENDSDNPVRSFQATYSSDIIAGNGKDNENFLYREDDFIVKYTVTLNTTQTLDAGSAVIVIPQKLLDQRDGQPIEIRDVDGIALPMFSEAPTKNPEGSVPLYSGGTITPSTRTQFGYYIDNEGNYVIVNYAAVKPGSTWFEVVYDEVNVFDAKDGLKNDTDYTQAEPSWTIDPKISAQYKFEKECWVYVGNMPNETTDSITLSSKIKNNWTEYMSPTWEDEYRAMVADGYDVFGGLSVMTDGENTYYGVDNTDKLKEYTDDPSNGWDSSLGFLSMLLYTKDDSGEPVLTYRQIIKLDENMKFVTSYQKLVNNEWVDVSTEDEPKSATRRATKCLKDGETYYRVLTTETANSNQAISVYTYYNSEGDPVYQRKVQPDGSAIIRRAESGAWVDCSESELPTVDWVYETYEKSSDPLTGLINTKVELEPLVKKVGDVTDTVKGNLNSKEQILSFIPQAQRSAIEPKLDLDKYIYVLWDVDVSGKDVTQPFRLYLDEMTSYSTGAVDENQQPLTYTYYDASTGNVLTNTEANKSFIPGGEIIYVAGDETSTVPGYTSIYEDSQGLYYIGSAINDEVDGSAVSADADLSKARTTGSYSKKIKVVTAYPRDAAGDTPGVAIDTIVADNEGDYVYIPYDATLYDTNLWSAVNAQLATQAASGKGILADRKTVKQVLEGILNTALATQGNDNPLLHDFVHELAQTLPSTPGLSADFAALTTEEQIESYIIDCWKGNVIGSNAAQIKKACQDYLNDILESNLQQLNVTVGTDSAPLQSYRQKTVYREVRNDANAIVVPIDNKDDNETEYAQAVHQREDKDPSVPNGFSYTKGASGSKSGWIDMYDATTDEVFGSTFSFTVSTKATTFEETHPRSSAYFYDNASYVHLVTADDILTAEPYGTDVNGNQIYGGSYVLQPADYCYTSAKIVVNDQIYNIVDDSWKYGATAPTSDEFLIDKEGSVGRDWIVYVSYDGTSWVEYTRITMEDYLQEAPSDYSNNARGANVRVLDFSQDTQLPCRIKVEHNTIDYVSTVDMTLTAAIRKDSPLLGDPDRIATSLRNELYSTVRPDTPFTSEDNSIDVFKMRIRNYAGLYAENGKLTESGGTITATPGTPLLAGKGSEYDLLNRDHVSGNTLLSDDEKLTDDQIPATAFGDGIDASNVARMSRAVDVTKLEKASLAEKTSTYTNDLTHGRAHITYRIAGYEGYLLDASYKNEIDKLSSYRMLPGANRNEIYIYDLLPPGVEFEGYSGSNEKPVAGYLTSKANITDPAQWTATDKISVSAEVVSEDSPEWETWGGAANGDGRYLVKFKLTLEDAEDYDRVESGNWFWGVGIQFNANVSWERYTAAKNTPNLAVYVTPTETIGKHDQTVYKDDGISVPGGYELFKNDSANNQPAKTDFNHDTATDDYTRMYAKSQDLGEIARASSTAIGKQVRADADTYALYTDKTAVIKGENYTYNVNVENQAGGAVSGIILYDWLDGAGTNTENWKGTLRAVDTSALLLGQIYPVVYCYMGTDLARDEDGLLTQIPYQSQTTNQVAVLPTEAQWNAKGWVRLDAVSTIADVRAVAIALYADAAHTTPYTLNGKQTLSYKLAMKAPATEDTSRPYAVNMPNYCYVKVEGSTNQETPWVVQSDSKYYDDPGNKTVVLLGDRRMLKVAKHVESNYSDSEGIGTLGSEEELEFTFRLTRFTGYYENDVWKEGDVPCANVQYRIFNCTFQTEGTSDKIESLGQEVDAGIIHTTNENGEFVLKDGQCAVFQYVPSTINLVTGTAANTYDFDNYRITELSKPFWYEFKSVDSSTEGWYSGSNPDSPTSEPGVSEGNAYTGSQTYYKQTSMTVTNTYRPVIYLSKETVSVPGDLPTTDGLTAAQAAAKIEAFNTFKYHLWLFEYPINRMTGEYFQNGAYDPEADTDGDGEDSEHNLAAWRKFKAYYEAIGNDPGADTGDTYFAQINQKINSLTAQRNAITESDETQARRSELLRQIESWGKLKSALIADKAVFDAHIAAATANDKTFFSAPFEDPEGEWVDNADGNAYLYHSISDKLLLPIGGYADTAGGTDKSFSNRVSQGDTRLNGPYLYSYTVGSAADIYSTPDGWIEWEVSDAENRRQIHATSNPIEFEVRAGTVVALPIYFDGGMMYSDFGIGDATADTWDGLSAARYLQRYCYQIQEAMDDQYWDDAAGTYKTITDAAAQAAERSWEVQTPSGNVKQKNALGAYGDNYIDYDNNYRFKDIYLQKSVEPADHVPKGDAANSVETTAFVYKVTRRALDAGASDPFDEIPPNIRSRMTWELWTRDEDGKLLEKQMIGPVNADGMLVAPIANYTGASTLYTIKIRNAEVGYTYRVEEVMKLEDLFGTGYSELSEENKTAQRSTAIASKFPYITYNAASNTFTYNTAGANAVTFTSDSFSTTQDYILATQELYAVDGTDTSGALKISDNDSITSALSKVDMSIDNVYRLRDLTVTKSIVAKSIDPEMAFTMRVRRRDLAAFAPTAIRFYRMVDGDKVYLTESEIKALQGDSTLDVTSVYDTVTSGSGTPTQVFRYACYVPALMYYDADAASAAERQSYGDTGYYYLSFRLRDGYYAEIVDIGYEKDEYQIAEEDWSDMNEEGAYIHLDPVDDAATELSAWKSVELGDNTSCQVRNGDEGYMILAKTYVSDSAGDYDEYARSLLQTGDDHKVTLELKIGEKNSGSEPASRTIPAGFVTISGSTDPVTDLSSIKLKGGQTVIVNLKGLCEAIGIDYDNVVYEVTETIPDDIRFFDDPTADVLYSVERITDDEEMKGDKNRTSVDVCNQVTKYSSVIYKRLGGNSSWTPPASIDGPLVLELRDGGGNSRQEGVKWIATGKTFSLDSAKLEENHGVTGEDGTLTVHSFDGWSNTADGNLTYYVKVYFNETVECNLTRSDNAQVLEVREDLLASDDNWGYLIGYETYGNADTYVSQSALEDMTQWHRKQDTIVNTVETTGTRKVEVTKRVYNRSGSLTDTDKTAQFTFTVKQWINGAYTAAPGIRYAVYDEDGHPVLDEDDLPVTGVTDSTGSFTLQHGQTAQMELPLFAYWEITETGKGDYRLLVDETGEIVYDKDDDNELDTGVDGLAPDKTAEDDYNAKRAASGFTLNTDLDIQSGIKPGEDVILIRMVYGTNNKSGNGKQTDFWRCGIRFAIPMEGADDSPFYSWDALLVNGNDAAKHRVIFGVNQPLTDAGNSERSNLFSALVRQIGTDFTYKSTAKNFEDVAIKEIYAYDKSAGGIGTLIWSKTKPTGDNANDFLGTELTDRGNPISESCGWTNKKYLTNDNGSTGSMLNNNIVIPEQIYVVYSNGDVKLHTVVGIGKNAGRAWYENASTDQKSLSIASLTIPKSVKKIGDYAFYRTDNLKAINIPDGSELTYIGQYAFTKQTAAEMSSTLNLPDTLEYIGQHAFENSYHFSGDFVLPYSLEYIGWQALRPNTSNNDVKDNDKLAFAQDAANKTGAGTLWVGSKEYHGDDTVTENPIVPVYTNIKMLVSGNKGNGSDMIDFHGSNNWQYPAIAPYSRLLFKTVIVGEGVKTVDGAFKNFKANPNNNNFYTHEYIFPKSLEETTGDVISHFELLIVQGNDISKYSGKYGYEGGKRYVVFTDLTLDEYTAYYNAITVPDQWQGIAKYIGSYDANKGAYYKDGKQRVYFVKGMTQAERQAVVDKIKEDYGSMSVYAERVILGQNILGSTPTTQNLPKPPVHTQPKAAAYLAEAIWLNEKRRSN
ncbi:MAG: leucine-rich repeat protein [Oscillospiraceae bacterium]|nr:leucine-rich repeat protein [Oscillospiraceae bacterium]